MNTLVRIELLIRKYASIPVAIVCLAVLALFVSIGYRSVLGPVLGGTIGALTAIILLHIRQPSQTESTWTLPDYRIAAIVASLYVVTIFTTYRFVHYEQPLIHYLVFGGFTGYIGYEIATGARRIRVIPQLLVLLFVTYWSVQLAFPAGMNEPDTRGKYLPAIREALNSGTIDGMEIYLGHLVYVMESIVVTGLSPQTGYFLLATLVLTGTALTIATLDLAFPSISRQVALYGALFFGCMGWTLGRGFHPTKLSFFYALTLLLGMVVVIQYATTSREVQRRWIIIGGFVGLSLIFGHQYSAGAALVFLVAITGFAVLAPVLPTGVNRDVRRFQPVIFSIAYFLAIMGNPIHGGPLTSRLVSLVTSIFIPESTGSGTVGGPGRYSELSLELLLGATSGEAILFGLGVLGAAIAIRRTNWEYDLVIFWMGVVAAFIAISLLFNAADTQPQRFYSLLGLFGLNIFAGFALMYLVRVEINWFTPRTVGVVIFAFAVMSLASPIAGIHLSIISDDVPHYRLYDTNQLSEGEEWTNMYEGRSETILQTMPPSTELPFNKESQFTVTVNTSEIQPGYRYIYTEVASETGVFTSGGLGLGDRTYGFLKLDPDPRDSVIYSNGETTIFQKE